jgi:CRISPR type III-A-associated protein Csm2
MVGNIGNSRGKFLDYCKYFEALVAYHKFYGGQ